jgi:hypothetical protein
MTTTSSFLHQNPTVKKKKDHNNTFLSFFFRAPDSFFLAPNTHLPQQHVLLLILLLAFVSFIISWIESVVPESPGSNGERKSRSSKTGVRCQQSNPTRFLPACNHYWLLYTIWPQSPPRFPNLLCRCSFSRPRHARKQQTSSRVLNDLRRSSKSS